VNHGGWPAKIRMAGGPGEDSGGRVARVRLGCPVQAKLERVFPTNQKIVVVPNEKPHSKPTDGFEWGTHRPLFTRFTLRDANPSTYSSGP